LLTALALFDVSKLVTPANPQADHIAGLRAEIADKTATVEKMAEDFRTGMPKAFAIRAQKLEAEIDSLTTTLAEAERTARIAEANENRDAYAEFKRMLAELPIADDDTRYQLRTRIVAELRRLIDTATAGGNELTVRLKADVGFGAPAELFIVDHRLAQIRVVEIETGDFFAFSREQIFEDPDFDFVGKFESFIQRETAAA
jgi:hypothetical protein